MLQQEELQNESLLNSYQDEELHHKEQDRKSVV